ncbi:MAG: helix-turn-helix domain-containing protein [Clostridia bacterium]|nr:helix-turn-helix domain-containing protein [Clostridia bacterium]
MLLLIRVIVIIGKIIKEYREARKMSLKELSNLTGITDSRLSRIESDKNHHQPFEDVFKIIKALDISIMSFLQDAGLYNPADYQLKRIELLTQEELAHVQSEIDFILDHKELK